MRVLGPVSGGHGVRSAAVAVRVTGQAFFHAMPGVLHGFLRFLPAHARLALRLVPAAFQLGLGLRGPGCIRARRACLGAIAVGRAVVVEAVPLLVVVLLVELLREMLVGVLVGTIGPVGAAVGILHRGACGIPVQAGLAAGLVPTRLQLRLGLVPVAAAGFVAVLGAHAIGGCIVAVEIAVALVVLALGGVLAPVFDLGGRVHAFGQ